MIEARGLVKRYGSTTAVSDLSFSMFPPISNMRSGCTIISKRSSKQVGNLRSY
jgi:hypothetical protein